MGFIINPYFFGDSFAVTPADFGGGAFRWYDAASFNYLADGALITAADPWDDLSANNDNATTDAIIGLTFETNVFGARPAVRFGGAANNRFLFDGGFFSLTDFTILCVTKNITGDSFALSRTSTNRQVRIFRSGVNVLSFLAGGSEIITATLATSETSARLNGWIRSGTAMSFYENDTPVAGGVDGNAIDLEQIGNESLSPLMDVGELVIYNSPLSGPDVQSLYDGYFQPKFGLP